MFLTAGAAKVVDRSVPLLPWVEIVLGGLLAGFTLWLLTHRGTPCACFGAWSRRPVGWPDVARNVALIGVAVLVAAHS